MEETAAAETNANVSEAGPGAGSSVAAEAAEAYANALATSARIILEASVEVTAAMTESANAMGSVVPVMAAVVEAGELLAAAEDDAVTALSPMAAAAAAMQNATGLLTAELQASINGAQAMASAQSAATKALDDLAVAAANAAGNANAGNGGPGGGGQGGNGGPGGGGQGGNGGPGGGRGGRRGGGGGGGRGLGRMLGAFYLANEGKRVIDAEAEYDNEADLAGNDQQAQFKAVQRKVKADEGGIFGLVAGEIVDPLGHRMSAAEDVAKGAEDSTARDDALRAGVQHEKDLDLANEAELASSRPEVRKAEQDQRDAERLKEERAEDETRHKAKEAAAKAKDDAVAAADQDLKAASAKGDALYTVAKNTGALWALGGTRADFTSPEEAAAQKAHDQALTDADAQYQHSTSIADAQYDKNKAKVDAGAAERDRRAKQKDDAEDRIFDDTDGAEKAGLTEDVVTERVDKKEAEVLKRAQALRDAHRDADADAYMRDIGTPAIEREKRVATVSEESRHADAERGSADLESEAAEIHQRMGGDAEGATLALEKREQADREAKAQESLDAANAGGNDSNIADATAHLRAVKDYGAAYDAEQDDDRARRGRYRAEDSEEAARDTLLRDRGDDYAATQSLLSHQAERDIDEIKRSSVPEDVRDREVTARQSQFESDSNAAKHQDQRRYDHMRVETEETLLRADHRGGEADVLAVRERVRDDERAVDATGRDPDADAKLAIIKASGNADLVAIQKSLVPQTQFGLTNTSYFELMQERAVQGQHSQDAIRAAHAASADIDKTGINHAMGKLDHPLGVDGPHTLDGLNGAAKVLQEAAESFAKNTKHVYVVGRDNS